LYAWYQPLHINIQIINLPRVSRLVTLTRLAALRALGEFAARCPALSFFASSLRRFTAPLRHCACNQASSRLHYPVLVFRHHTMSRPLQSQRSRHTSCLAAVLLPYGFTQFPRITSRRFAGSTGNLCGPARLIPLRAPVSVIDFL